MTKSDLPCPTPKCVDYLEKYGYSNMVVFSERLDCYRCERCGGMSDDGTEWKHECQNCHVKVEPGKLTGLFVPHLCNDCEQKIADDEIRRRCVCGRCHQPYSRCCC